MEPTNDTSALTTLSEASSLRMAVLRLSRRLRAHRADDTLSDAQLAILGALRVEGPFTLSALATHERVSAPSMTRTINCLADAGYVTRVADSTDGRKVSIALTPSGLDVVQSTAAKRDAWLEDALTGLSAEEHDILVKAATILRRVAEK